MNSKKGFFEEALESGTTLAKQTGKTASKVAADTTKAVVSQTGLPGGADTVADDFVKDLYGKSDDKQLTNNNSQLTNKATQEPSDAGKNLSQEEQQKLAEVRTKLQKRHDEFYYEPLINPKGEKPEERPAEKVEKEKQEEMIDLQEKKKKEVPVLVQRNQQKTEKFPGGGG